MAQLKRWCGGVERRNKTYDYREEKKLVKMLAAWSHIYVATPGLPVQLQPLYVIEIIIPVANILCFKTSYEIYNNYFYFLPFVIYYSGLPPPPTTSGSSLTSFGVEGGAFHLAGQAETVPAVLL